MRHMHTLLATGSLFPLVFPGVVKVLYFYNPRVFRARCRGVRLGVQVRCGRLALSALPLKCMQRSWYLRWCSEWPSHVAPFIA